MPVPAEPFAGGNARSGVLPICRSSIASALLLCSAPGVVAQTVPLPMPGTGPADAVQRIDELGQRLAAQAAELAQLKLLLTAQSSAIESLRRALAASPDPDPLRTAAPSLPAPEFATPAIASAVPAAAPQPSSPTPLPPLASLFEQPGVLTPPGRFALEPALQYAYSSSNRVALVGYTVIPAILVGLIDVREVKRSTWTGSLSLRHGVSRRFEIEAKLPYVYRSDTSIGRELLQGSAGNAAPFNSAGRGLGDVEFTARHQINEGGADRPFYIGSLRVKSRTGTDPFEVTTSAVPGSTDAVQTRLPTGSGFWAVQPALTVLYPSDPAVFFGSVSYLHNIRRNEVVLATDQGPERLGKVAPGGIYGFNFGMGIALNEKSSFSMGYDHSSVGKTRIDGAVAIDSVRLQLGTLLLGYSLKLDDTRSVNLALGAGLTRDTPDVTLTLRVPTAF